MPEIIAYNEDCFKRLPLLRNVDLIVTDPPYNVSAGRKNITYNGKRKDLILDYGEWDKIEDYDNFSFQWLAMCKQLLKPGKMLCTFWDRKQLQLLLRLLDTVGFKFIDFFFTVKSNPMPSIRKASFSSGVEVVAMAQKPEGSLPFNKEDVGHPNYKITSCVQGKQRLNHPTQKHIEVIKPLIQYWSKLGEWVLDPFAGTFTTAEAALELDRNIICIEKNQDYFDMGINRIEKGSEQNEY